MKKIWEFIRHRKHDPSNEAKTPTIAHVQLPQTSTPKIPIIEKPSYARPSVPQIIIPDPSAPSSTQGDNDKHPSPSGWSPGRSSRANSISSKKSSSSRTNLTEYSIRSKHSTAGVSLSAQLRRVRIECPGRPHSFFIPISDLIRLITIPNIEKDIRDKLQHIEPAEIKYIAEKACLVAPKLFAILAFLKKGSEIYTLLRDEVSDKDLPLRRIKDKNGDFTLRRDSGKSIDTCGHWIDYDIEEFDRIQWWMMAPVFEDKHHYELEESTVLPFIPFKSSEDTELKKEGGYSEVYAAKIHPAHHNFWECSKSEDEEPLVAIKRLYSSAEIEFQKEVTILKALASKKTKHPHLITLLCTFKHKGKYHLIFPYADANLRTYWEVRPSPSFDRATVLWSLRQMTGIAHALDSIHNFTVTYPLSVDGKVRLQQDAKLWVDENEQLFGRHGDIKPENILWFKKAPEIEDDNGVLQIADFGLGRFHGRDSRSQVNPDGILGSPTYEPPECKLYRPVSRAYDIWSLGCLFLEFVTWLLKGSAEIEGFSNFRGRLAVSTLIDDDNFYTIIKDPSGEPDATVREEVVTWVQQLHEHYKCSQAIHDVLNVIMKDVLIIDSTKRAKARWLFQMLNNILIKGTRDEEYLLRPAPQRPKLLGISYTQSTPTVPEGTKKKTVAFVSQKKSKPSTPGDLVRTPGLIRRSNTHGTWPPLGHVNG